MTISGLVIGTYLAVLIVLAVYGMHRTALISMYYRNKARRPKPAGRFSELPVVTVQLPLFNEMYVVERLLDAVAGIRYPRDRFQIQVLDDSTDETQEICKRKIADLGTRFPELDVEYIHRTDRTGFKAGALHNGLETAKGEFILIFDADFVPMPDILERAIDHFTDPKVAVVQCRWEHINRDYSGLTEVQALMLDGHFIMEHAGRNWSGRFFNFNGTAGMWRRSAIADAGDWQHDTLTEDMDLSYRAQLRGWKFVYLPEIAAPAELPVEMSAFKSQQFRWAKGSVQVAKKLLGTIFRSNATWEQKSEAFFHLTNNLAYPLLLVLSILLLPNLALRTHHGWREVLMIDFPLFFGTTLSISSFYLASQREIALLRIRTRSRASSGACWPGCRWCCRSASACASIRRARCSRRSPARRRSSCARRSTASGTSQADPRARAGGARSTTRPSPSHRSSSSGWPPISSSRSASPSRTATTCRCRSWASSCAASVTSARCRCGRAASVRRCAARSVVAARSSSRRPGTRS